MSCPDAPAATIVNSAIAASSDKVRAARSVFKIIFPLHFQTLGTCNVVCQKDRARTTPCYKTHAAAGTFNRVVLFGLAPPVDPALIHPRFLPSHYPPVC